MLRHLLVCAVVLTLCHASACLAGENRDEMVRSDKKKMDGDESWIYNDFAKGLEEAKKAGKPLMVVMRCIPCHACKLVDEDVAARDKVSKDLMDKFVCVRLVQANNLDLTFFQFDYDMSWAVLFMNADKTIYARFGSRFEQRQGNPDEVKASLQGLRKCMESVLAVHQGYPGNKGDFANKQPKPVTVTRPEDFPKLKDYKPNINYETNTAKSCLHCHQIRDAEREANRASMPEPMLFPYPNPETIGLNLDPAQTSKVASVAAGSPAEKAGVKAGDELAKLDGQPVCSIADVVWALHHFKSGALAGEVKRGAESKAVTFNLDPNWRALSDMSWRVSTWALRGKALGGMILEDLSADERQKLNLAANALGVRIKGVGAYGEHALAKNSGFMKNDVIVEFDGLATYMTESQIIAHIIQKHKLGDAINVSVMRAGQKKQLTYKVQ